MTQVLLAIIIGLGVISGLQTFRISLMQKAQLTQQIEQGKATIRQLDAAQLQTAAMQGEVDAANRRLAEFANQQKPVLAKLNAELAGLRRDLDAAAKQRDVSEAACAPHIARIRLAEELFFRCSQRYTSVAGDAAKWQAYAGELNGAWPGKSRASR